MKCKKVIASTLLVTMCMTGTALAFEKDTDTLSTSIKSVTLNSTSQVITGKIPQFENMRDKELEKKLNKIVGDLYEKKVAEAKELKSPGINFEYEIKESEKYISVLVYTYISSGNTGSDEVNTIVIDKDKHNQIETLVDLMGSNAYKIANNIISETIKVASSGTYFTEDGFDGTNSATKFYVDDNGKAVIIFDKYEIAPGSSGMPKFEIDMSKIKEVKVPFADTLLINEERMIPIRPTLEQLGFKVALENNNTVSITKGSEKHTLVKGEKAVENGREIENALVFNNGKGYTPIFYLETILNIAYSADENQYTLTAMDSNLNKQVQVEKYNYTVKIPDSLKNVKVLNDSEKTEIIYTPIDSNLSNETIATISVYDKETWNKMKDEAGVGQVIDTVKDCVYVVSTLQSNPYEDEKSIDFKGLNEAVKAVNENGYYLSIGSIDK
ncbi:copper amine oxidase domain-containing protein [Gottschalkia acidurici 9a]|uniref:Copper amine oxidase domain-containing protein n=1 Tax=Gottschalkia acidurici (strain ATCC 7906 / DSM 604 / BCRC 14475 / CIP 104303 / KCTC 5404 / NCIMB 10678 / 9a) TaxID=1128398 RepID=K0B2N5_GOTA9|nr:DUF3298 domain-containing protein [Gottschalkia acidurici]AFS79759.1 copper amine oxidase domain-containing protein [Gottschalkia acidurici 9a]